MRRLAIIAGIVIALAGLAGCIGGDGETSQPADLPANDTRPTLEEHNVSFDTSEDLYAYDAEDRQEVRWVNDSFSPASCFACPSGEHRIDVTGMLPRGAPSLLQASVNTSPTLFPGVSISLETEGAEVYQTNGSFEQIEAVLAPQGGTAEIVVQNDVPDADSEIAYELRIQVDANRTVFPAGAPIAFPAPEEPAGIVVDGAPLEGEAHMMLWDGEDRFLGHHSIAENTTINVTQAEGGPLVGYIAGAEGYARVAPVNASATPQTMRPLATAWQEAAEPVESGEVQIEPEITQVPLQGGLFLAGSFDAGGPYSGELLAGNETLVSFESGGYTTGPESRFTWMGEPGGPELVPGNYLASFQFSQSSGGEAGAMWRTYER